MEVFDKKIEKYIPKKEKQWKVVKSPYLMSSNINKFLNSYLSINFEIESKLSLNGDKNFKLFTIFEYIYVMYECMYVVEL